MRTIEESKVLTGHRAPPGGVVEAGKRLFTWPLDEDLVDGTVRIWRASSGELLHELEYPKLFPSGAAVRPDGSVVTYDDLCQLHLYDVSAGERVSAFKDSDSTPMGGLAVLPDSRVAYWGWSGVRFRAPEDWELCGEVELPSCQWGRLLEDHLIVSSGDRIHAIDPTEMRREWELDVQALEVEEGPAGQHIVRTTGQDLVVVDADDGSVIARPEIDEPVDGVGPVGEDRWVAFGGVRRPRLFALEPDPWRVECESEEIHDRERDAEYRSRRIEGVEVADDRRLVSWDASDRPALCLWDPAELTRQTCMPLPLADRSATQVRLDRKRTHAVVFSNRPDIRLYDLRQPEEVAVLEGHDARVLGVRQLGDGRLISWSVDKTLRIWEVDELA